MSRERTFCWPIRSLSQGKRAGNDATNLEKIPKIQYNIFGSLISEKTSVSFQSISKLKAKRNPKKQASSALKGIEMIEEQSNTHEQNEIAENPENTGRQQDGRFCKGASGNPAGRPKGSRNRATRVAEAMLEGEAHTLVRKAIDLAVGGDSTALRLCVERILPRRTERTIEFDLPQVSAPKDAAEVLSRIMEGVGAGELTPNEARSLVCLVEAALKGIELVDHERRLTALEHVHDAKK